MPSTLAPRVLADRDENHESVKVEAREEARGGPERHSQRGRSPFAQSRELQRVLVSSFETLPEDVIDRADDTIRWQSLGARCAEARGARGIRDAAIALDIPQYRLRAIEGGRFTEFRIDLARRYFRFLAIEEWVKRWCRPNRELATRVGLIESRAPSAGLPLLNAGRR